MGARQGQQQQQGPRDQSCAVTWGRGGGHRTKPGSPCRSSTHQSRAVAPHHTELGAAVGVAPALATLQWLRGSQPQQHAASGGTARWLHRRGLSACSALPYKPLLDPAEPRGVVFALPSPVHLSGCCSP